VSIPGPTPLDGGAALLGLTALAVLVGEGIRLPLARRAPLFRVREPIERFLLDFYLGGAVLYVVAALPGGWFTPVPVGAAVVAALGSLVWGLRGSRTLGHARAFLRETGRVLGNPFVLATLLSALGLGLLEASVAGAAATGNTFDSSVDTLFVSLLGLHASIPLSLAPIASGWVAYPQGSTVWFAAAQSLAGFPPPRTALLVTPLFMALAPLGAYCVGRRWLGSASAGAACAIVFAVLGPGTRGYAGGSNDFVLAFPLVLLLVALSHDWATGAGPTIRDAVAFGSLAGYSAAINPVGAEWLFLLVPFWVVASGARGARVLGRWGAAWGVAVASALPWVAPSLVGIGRGAVAPARAASGGWGLGTFVSLADPFVIRPTVQTFSPYPLLSVELAGLLIVGAVVLLWAPWRPGLPGAAFGRWAVAGVASALVWLSGGLLAHAGWHGLDPVLAVTSPGEMSSLLFAVFALVVAVPLVVLFRRAEGSAGRPGPGPPTRPEPNARRPAGGALDLRIASIGLAIAVLMPGAVLTGTELPTTLGTLYSSFSNVTAGDFAMLEWAGAHLPPGSRVLVAPGSAAEFLPGYAPGAVLVYPMTGPGWRSDPEYLDLCGRLENGSLGGPGLQEVHDLRVQYIAVTGASSVLFAPFDPKPLLDSAAFSVDFHDADAYLFAVSTSTVGPLTAGAGAAG
jgi:hypothetical protein